MLNGAYCLCAHIFTLQSLLSAAVYWAFLSTATPSWDRPGPSKQNFRGITL